MTGEGPLLPSKLPAMEELPLPWASSGDLAASASGVARALEARDMPGLRALAVAQGLGTSEARRRAWPALVGVDPDAIDEAAVRREMDLLASCEHRDKMTVEADVNRSLWAFTEGAGEEERRALRAQLRRVIDAAIVHAQAEAAGPSAGSAAAQGSGGADTLGRTPEGSFWDARSDSGGRSENGGTGGRPSPAREGVFYYQGLHSVASVLLMTVGEERAYLVLRRAVRGHLRDLTRERMEPAMATLELLTTLVRFHDGRLFRALASLEWPPGLHVLFAMPWVLTWLSHSAAGPHCLPHSARLFDAFLAGHPLLPLYAAACVLRGAREGVLALVRSGAGFPDVHGHLSKVRLAAVAPDPGALVGEAAALFGRLPPEVLTMLPPPRARTAPLYAPFAVRGSDGAWRLPPSARTLEPFFAGELAGRLLQGLGGQVPGMGWVMPRSRRGMARRVWSGAWLAAVALAGVCVVTLEDRDRDGVPDALEFLVALLRGMWEHSAGPREL